MYLVGIDIGGTNLKVGLIENNKIVNRLVRPTNSFDLIKQIVTVVNEVLDISGASMSDVELVGVGCPGIISNGVVVESPNLQMIKFDLQSILMEEFRKPVVVNNDADMATIAEFKLGAGVGTENMVLLTIGTGVGGGSIVDGKLLTGQGGAGEFGHITYVKDGIQCNCGRKGCIEKYASARALLRRIEEKMQEMPSNISMTNGEILITDIMNAYNSGDECARIVVDEYVEDLASLVMSLCNVFRPEKVVIAGGITHAPKLIGMVADICKKNFYGYKSSPKVDIVPASLGYDAGMLGAAAHNLMS